MKHLKSNLWILLALFFAGFTACNNNDDPIPGDTEPAVSYILNYGTFGSGNSSITAYDRETGTVTNNYFENVNTAGLVSNVQHSVNYNGKVYFVGNNPDQVFWVDAETFIQSENGISSSEDLVQPRYAVGQGNYLYVSCWGGNIWENSDVSYVAKINLTSKTVEKKFPVAGGPEGLAIANNKLFMALNYENSVAVLDLGSEVISYINTPAVTSYFLKDKNNNLYVSLLSTFSNPSETTGLGYINTSTEELEAVYELEGVSTSYVNILEADDNFTKIFVVASEYDENWNLIGGISVFNVATKTFEPEKFIDNISGLNGVEYFNDRLFVFIAETVTANGKAKIYLPDGTKEADFETGIAPFMMVTAR